MRDTLRMMHTPKGIFMLALKQGVGLAPVPGAGEGIVHARPCFPNPGVSGRAAAALLLAHERDKQTIQALRDALSGQDWSVRAAAVHALARHNDPPLLPEIAVLTADRKEAVRLRAAAAAIRLERIGQTRAKRNAPRHAAL